MPRLIIVIAASFEGQRREGLRHLDLSASVTTRPGSLGLPKGLGFTGCGFHRAGLVASRGLATHPTPLDARGIHLPKCTCSCFWAYPQGVKCLGTVQKAAVD